MKKFGAWIAPFLVAAFVFTPARGYTGVSHDLRALSGEELCSERGNKLLNEVSALCNTAKTKDACHQLSFEHLCSWNQETDTCRLDFLTLSKTYRSTFGMVANMAAILLGSELLFSAPHVEDVIVSLAMMVGGALTAHYGIASSLHQCGVSEFLEAAWKRENLSIRTFALAKPNPLANDEHVLVIEETPANVDEQEQSISAVEAMLREFEAAKRPKSLLWARARDTRSLRAKLGRLPENVKITHIVIHSKHMLSFVEGTDKGDSTLMAFEPLRKLLEGQRPKVFLEIDDPEEKMTSKNFKIARQRAKDVERILGSSMIVFVPNSAPLLTTAMRMMFSLPTMALGAYAGSLLSKKLEIVVAGGLLAVAATWDSMPQIGWVIDGSRDDSDHVPIGNYTFSAPLGLWPRDDKLRYHN